MSPSVGATDLQLITDLVKTCEVDGQLDEDTSIADLESLLKNSSRSLRRLWRDASGKKLRGFGQLWIPKPTRKSLDGYLWFYVHPSESLGQSFGLGPSSLEIEILNWAEKQLQGMGKKLGLRVNLHTTTRDDALIRIATVERYGFTPERSFLTMAKSNFFLGSVPQFPPGFTLRSVDPKRDAKAWIQMYNESFIDHWDHHELTLEVFNQWHEDPHYRSPFDLVAIAPNGELAAFCQGHVPPAAETGWIRWLGTRRRFRKMGLGRAILQATMQRFYFAGVKTVKLGVDADSLTGATRLYESLGFQPVQTWLYFVKHL